MRGEVDWQGGGGSGREGGQERGGEPVTKLQAESRTKRSGNILYKVYYTSTLLHTMYVM